MILNDHDVCISSPSVMASSSSLLSEDQLQCSICLDVFTDPVSTPCGHNFCMVCLKECWDSSSRCQCPVCMEKFHKRPELRVNTFISGLAALFKKSVQVKSSRAGLGAAGGFLFRPPGQGVLVGGTGGCWRQISCSKSNV